MSAAAKLRVDHATCLNSEISGKRCLIENTDVSNAVEYAHCLPRATKGGLLDSLEFAWNMSRYTLNVDTRANVIRLSSKFHRLFDSNLWLLLPETSIIDIYHKARKKPQFPNIDHPVYRYTLVAHPDMLLVPIHRQNSIPTDENMPPVDFTLYSHPYHTFPTIVSHVHPRFIICNTGAKLIGSFDWAHELVRDRDMIKVHNIWKEWSKVVNQSQPGGQSFVKRKPTDDDPDIGDNDSQHTAQHRVLRSQTKRKLPEQQGSPTPKSSKQQKLADDGVWLDDETLHEFDQQTSSRAEQMGSKKRLIMDWLSDLSTVGVSENLKGNNAISDVTVASGALTEHF